MIKYIITWILIKLVPAPCPDPMVKYDEFGQVIHLKANACAVSHFQQISEKNSREFTNKDSACAFFDRALASQLDSLKFHSVVDTEIIRTPWKSHSY